MIKLSKEAQVRQQRMLELEEEEELMKAQLEYTRAKTQKLRQDLESKKANMNSMQEKNTLNEAKNEALRQ